MCVLLLGRGTPTFKPQVLINPLYQYHIEHISITHYHAMAEEKLVLLDCIEENIYPCTTVYRLVLYFRAELHLMR